MLHHKIMGILLSLHEKASGPLQRVYEICLESMENVERDIKSVAELPQIPFTTPIRRKIEAAMEPETETETNSPEISKKRRRTKKPISESESSTSTTFSRHKRSKKATKGYMDSTSTSHSSHYLMHPYQSPSAFETHNIFNKFQMLKTMVCSDVCNSWYYC